MNTTKSVLSLLLVASAVVDNTWAFSYVPTLTATSTSERRRFESFTMPTTRHHVVFLSTKLRLSSVNYLDSLSSPESNSSSESSHASFPSPPSSPSKPEQVGTFQPFAATLTSSFPAFPVSSSNGGTGQSVPILFPSSSIYSTSPAPTSSPGGSAVVFHHKPVSFFRKDKLSPKGPRANADVGTPHDSSRPLTGDIETSIPSNTISAGSWWCAAGGWPSLKQRTSTEIFYVLEGYGCLTDMDGVRHYFGPGDVCILPKGWSGRWDIAEDVHKLWLVHEHDEIEVNDDTVRIIVKHYHELVSSQYQVGPVDIPNALYDTRPTLSTNTLFDVGSTEVSSSTISPGSFFVGARPTTEGFIVLEGTFVLTNSDFKSKGDDDSPNNLAQRCGPGDLVLLPKGWSGYWDILETVKKVSVVV